jgi:hypothetical protein
MPLEPTVISTVLWDSFMDAGLFWLLAADQMTIACRAASKHEIRGNLKELSPSLPAGSRRPVAGTDGERFLFGAMQEVEIGGHGLKEGGDFEQVAGTVLVLGALGKLPVGRRALLKKVGIGHRANSLSCANHSMATGLRN